MEVIFGECEVRVRSSPWHPDQGHRVELQTIHRFFQLQRWPLEGSWLKAPDSAFSFKTLLTHYFKQALTQAGASSVIVKTDGSFAALLQRPVAVWVSGRCWRHKTVAGASSGLTSAPTLALTQSPVSGDSYQYQIKLKSKVIYLRPRPNCNDPVSFISLLWSTETSNSK